MYKILIVDDEPLARMGLSAMLSGCGLDVEVSGSAANGQAALDQMNEAMPDIVITDIRMPVMDGLELLEFACTHFHPAPAFILLTSYEDFSYARQALHLSASAYLLKMELTPETLAEALQRAINDVLARQSAFPAHAASSIGNVFVNRFYNNILIGGYHSESEILDIAHNFNLSIRADRYLAVCAQVKYPDSVKANYMQQYNLYLRVMDLIKSTVSRYAPCFVAASHFERIAFVLMLSRTQDVIPICEAAVQETDRLCEQYFDIRIACGASRPTEHLIHLSSDFTYAQSASHNAPDGRVHWHTGENQISEEQLASEQQFTRLERAVMDAIERSDIAQFNRIMDSLARAALCDPLSDAIALTSCVLHVVLTCLDNSKQLLMDAFSGYPQSYRSLYACTSGTELVEYHDVLRSTMISALNLRSTDPKYHLVADAKEYIRTHICDHLSLGEVAAAIGISQNYLSSLFRQYSELGFNDFVMSLKITTAKTLLSQEHLKVCQVSERLGFDNPHYFSKVFKKYTGISPSEAAAAGEGFAAGKASSAGA